jgi:cell division septum initiation protein DivIVA
MARRPDPSREAVRQQTGAAGSAQRADAPARPNLSGDLDTMLVTTPVFRRRLLGYDTLQVDNYVAWVEAELLTARRETDDVVDRYSRCWAELQVLRQAAGHSPAGREMAHLSERIGTMLELAADEAAALTAAAAAEADAQRQKAREITERAVADADRLRLAAGADRSEAAEVRDQALAHVAALSAQAREERERLDEAAAQARARLDAEAAERRERLDRAAAEQRDRAAAEVAERIRQQEERSRQEREAAEAAARERLAGLGAEIAELERRRDLARDCLVRMSDQVNEAVAALAEGLPTPGLRLVPAQRSAS